jgi:hypothetical protein
VFVFEVLEKLDAADRYQCLVAVVGVRLCESERGHICGTA